MGPFSSIRLSFSFPMWMKSYATSKSQTMLSYLTSKGAETFQQQQQQVQNGPKLVQPKMTLEERAVIENRAIWYYYVPRMPLSYKFPVYETVRSGGTRKLTIIKFVRGSVPVSPHQCVDRNLSIIFAFRSCMKI
jgi:hypothetical protein